MLEQTIFIVRNGSFGTDFATKLLTTFVGIFICFYDWRTQKRRDYFWVLLTGTIIWFTIEFTLQMTGIRVMSVNYLLGQRIPVWFASLLRGTSEGGVVAILGLLFGDRIADKNTRKRWSMIFLAVIALLVAVTLKQGQPAANVGGDVASRRDIFNLPMLSSLIVCIIFDIVWFLKTDRLSRLRGLYMFLVMAILGAAWTFAELLAHTRWIEVGSMGVFSRANLLIEFGALTWDVVFEIAAAYVPFLAIPSMLGLLKRKDK